MTEPPPRLVADVGGTHVRFALVAAGSIEPQHERTLLCADFPGPVEAVRRYLADAGCPVVHEAAFDVATGITGDFVRLTNGPWGFSIEATRRALALRRFEVINDFTALALGVPLLKDTEKQQIGAGAPVPGAAIGVIGAGTGLGVSGLLPHGRRWLAIQGEGGHTAFSPMSEREDAVLRVLRRRFGEHVSTERLVSGPGLLNLYCALCELDGARPAFADPAQITRQALGGGEARCVQTLEMFCAMLGTAAANLAVTLGARGGLYIGGGIVPKLGDYFGRSPFRARFECKGRFSAYLRAIPTYVILAQTLALRGLASVFDGGE
ncbi:MAG TPA: glucokinase [Burkholderiales bacterium]|jgi:glucokinase|nr:glucokinase [Burkholderiales bacterium]